MKFINISYFFLMMIPFFLMIIFEYFLFVSAGWIAHWTRCNDLDAFCKTRLVVFSKGFYLCCVFSMLYATSETAAQCEHLSTYFSHWYLGEFWNFQFLNHFILKKYNWPKFGFLMASNHGSFWQNYNLFTFAFSKIQKRKALKSKKKVSCFFYLKY